MRLSAPEIINKLNSTSDLLTFTKLDESLSKKSQIEMNDWFKNELIKNNKFKYEESEQDSNNVEFNRINTVNTMV